MSVASLPPNIRLKEDAQQNELLSRFISSPPPECDSCEKDKSISVAYCRDCDDLLCQECWDIHCSVKVLRSHSTHFIDDFKKKSQGNLLKILPSSSSTIPQYPDHDEQKLSFYCAKCAVLACDKCSTGRHKLRSPNKGG